MLLFLKQKQFLLSLVLVLGFLFVAMPQVSFAKNALVPCGGYQDDGVTPEPPCKFTDIFVLFARVTNWLVGVAGIYTVYHIISNAMWLVLSQGSEETITTHKKGITNAIVGLALVFIAYMLINFAINYLLAAQMPGKRLDLANPTCYLAPTTQNQCFK